MDVVCRTKKVVQVVVFRRACPLPTFMPHVRHLWRSLPATFRRHSRSDSRALELSFAQPKASTFFCLRCTQCYADLEIGVGIARGRVDIIATGQDGEGCCVVLSPGSGWWLAK